ncbi:NUDIX hydrolase [Defluviimonas sp. 20V17]|uniref:8-oxo-dGTP pyrophosphatase MutT, NUDIX family n=1 Tax=Allgaiera indica TaxID=765699 RepID=A0AAN4ZZU2_9RHOB|nr:NUDIX hydrolase [Allgaiera indica]KDB02245.1 NUDIX hydrolase [Defluviimonas sp. 20V17]GHE02659.1 hypothetical protein GCM10008024_23080 [Allgaiera indica]SDX19601.1 8-oxo-dGTP pyrophosphatase MutT, NUDIX family [Allgaiera indica]
MSYEGKANIPAQKKGKAVTTGAVGAEAGDRPPRTQYGALCWRRRRGGSEIEVLLVSSRETGRWIIPKGWPIKGLGPSETARQEAYEEAGVNGKVSDACAGIYSYTKLLGPQRSNGVPCVVAVYPIRVSKLLDDFPEREERRRRWFSPKKAAQKVDEPELRALLREFPEVLGKKGEKSGGPKKAS